MSLPVYVVLCDHLEVEMLVFDQHDNVADIVEHSVALLLSFSIQNIDEDTLGSL
jgi:hypothetical protein